MAEVSNVNDVSTKHIYDDIFASPPPAVATLNGSAFSPRIEDYAEVFASSSSLSSVASQGSSIPILDLPTVDRIQGRISDVDYSGVFGGSDDRIGVLFEEFLGASKKNAKREASLPRSPVEMRTPPSKSPEFLLNSGDNRPSTKPWTQPSKSQEFPRNSGMNQMPASSGNSRNLSSPGTQLSKSQEFQLKSENKQMPTSSGYSRISTSPGTRPSRSQEFPLTSGNNQRSTNASSYQSFDTAKHFSVSYHRTNVLNSEGMTHIAELHAVPGYTCLFDEAVPPKKTVHDNTTAVSSNDANVNMDINNKKKGGKHTRAISDLGNEKQASEHSSGFQRGFGGPLNSPYNAQEASCKTQASGLSSPLGFSHAFGGSSFLKRSTSQRSKGSPKSQQTGFGDAASLPILEEELDVNSEAAISAESVKRAIEEAEVQIRLAKVLLQRNDDDGSQMSFKDILKVRETGGVKCSGEASLFLRQKKVKTRSKKKHVDEVKGSKPKDYVDVKITKESKLANEVNGLHEDFVRVDATDEMAVNFGSLCAPETFEKISQYTEQRDPENHTEEVVRENAAHGEPVLAHKSHRQEGGGEWEAVRHLNQLFCGVKSRLVSFMSKQSEFEKKMTQMDVPRVTGSPDQSVKGAGDEMKDVDAQERGSDREEIFEKEFEVKHLVTTSPGAREREEDLHRTGAYMETRALGDSERKNGVDMGQENEEETLSPDAKKHNDESSDHLEPELEVEKIQMQELRIDEDDCGQDDVPTEVKGELTQGEPQAINQHSFDDSAEPEHEKGQMDTIKLEEHHERSKVVSSSGGHDDDAEVTGWESRDERVKEIQAEVPLDGKADDSHHSVNVNSGLEEGCSWEEGEIMKDSHQREEDIQALKDTAAMEEFSERIEDEEACMGEEHEKVKPDDNLSEETTGQAKATNYASLHNEHLAATDNVCKLADFSFLRRIETSSNQENQSNEIAHDVEFSCNKMGTMTGLTATLPEPSEESEKTSSVKVTDGLISEETMTAPILTGHAVDMDETKGKIKDDSEALQVNFEIWPCEIETNYEQKFEDGKRMGIATNDRFGHYVDTVGCKSEAGADVRGADVASDENEGDLAMHKHEEKHSIESSSHKRRRWFENREEVESSEWPSILVEDEVSAGTILEEEHAEGSELYDCGEVYVDKLVNEVGEGVSSEPADAALDQQGGHNIEATHRRGRWFDNSEETGIPQKPSLFNGNGTSKEMDQAIPDNSMTDVHCESHVKESDCERSDGTSLANLGENRVNMEAAHKRKRWFENGEKSESGQQVHILEEDKRAPMEVEDEIEKREDIVKPDQLGETSTTESESSDTYGKVEPENFRQSRDLGEANDRKREREKERIAVERAILEARERALAEARERAERAAAEKVSAEACLKAAAQEQPAGKASTSSEANNKSISDKASLEVKLRAERAAVETAIAEARGRALQKAMSDKAAHKAREKDHTNQTSSPSGSSRASTSASTKKSSGAVNESPQRRKARLERNKGTMERVAKALEEKNMRDSLAQSEQAERNKFADALDSEVKSWSSGKEGNLRALLSTLQYVLGPDSGWRPTPLKDLVSATAVRKAYKRAALIVHPDKLQQRGATIQQKYICEKVFDLLKEAWNEFNPDDR